MHRLSITLTFLFGLFCLVYSCQNNKTGNEINSENTNTSLLGNKEEIEVLYDYIPSYEKQKIDGKVVIDTNYRKVKKERRIFRKGKTYTYKATYLSDKNDTLSVEKIEFEGTGERMHVEWREPNPKEVQDRVIFNFFWKKEDSLKFVTEPRINKKFTYALSWQKSKAQGIIENEEKVWIHPIRYNQYLFTQVAPYPEAELPLFVGKKWQKLRKMYDGQLDWNYAKIQNDYVVKGKETLETPFGELHDCWYIEAESNFHMGKSLLNFHFHKEHGFVKMFYTNYIGDKLIVEIVSIDTQ